MDDLFKRLRIRFGDKYLLWKALSNNGRIAEMDLPEGSISLPDRDDVKAFRDFIETHISPHDMLLDIGTGIQQGYLRYLRFKFLWMLDPFEIKATRARFYFKINAVAEDIPIQDDFFHVVIAATSLDHMIDLGTALKEIHRVTKPGGKFLVWTSDRSNIPIAGVVEYPNGSVFFTPPGAVDPFHADNLSIGDQNAMIENAAFKAGEFLNYEETNYFLAYEK